MTADSLEVRQSPCTRVVADAVKLSARLRAVVGAACGGPALDVCSPPAVCLVVEYVNRWNTWPLSSRQAPHRELPPSGPHCKSGFRQTPCTSNVELLTVL